MAVLRIPHIIVMNDYAAPPKHDHILDGVSSSAALDYRVLQLLFQSFLHRGEMMGAGVLTNFLCLVAQYTRPAIRCSFNVCMLRIMCMYEVVMMEFEDQMASYVLNFMIGAALHSPTNLFNPRRTFGRRHRQLQDWK